MGYKGEAVRLVNAIYILVGKRSRNHTSIMEHLGKLDHMNFPTTVPENNESGSPTYDVLLHTVGPNIWNLELTPRGLNDMMNGRILNHISWWQEIIMKGGDVSISRELLVRAVRDRDGGAHFDSSTSDPNYIAALRGELIGFNATLQAGNTVPVPFAIETTIRQIAEEIRMALRPIRPPSPP
jgi:hypothetical protein